MKADAAVADCFRQGGEAGLEVLDDCRGKFDLKRWPRVGAWMTRIEAMPGCKAPLDLLPMHDAA